MNDKTSIRLAIVKTPYFNYTIAASFLPPLSLTRLYAYLKGNGYTIFQKDLNSVKYNFFRNFFIKKILFFLSRFPGLFVKIIVKNSIILEKLITPYLSRKEVDKIDVLLISVYSYDTLSSMVGILIAAWVKLVAPEKIIVVGGESNQLPYIYNNFSVYSKAKIIDYYVEGAGEMSLSGLLKNISIKKDDMTDVLGLVYDKKGTVVHNANTSNGVVYCPGFEGLNIADYAWDKSGFFVSLDPGRFKREKVVMLPYSLSVGCPSRCAFCPSSYEKRFSYISPEQAADELAKMSKRYNNRYFFFLDSTVNPSKDFTVRFCKSIIKSKLNIYWTACASCKGVDDPDILMLMREAGACRLIFGLETASPRLLEFISKNVSASHAAQCMKWSHEAGIMTDLEIIAGLPTETDSDIKDTIDFLIRNKEYIDIVWANKFYLSEGSLMFREPGKYGLTNIRKNNWHNRWNADGMDEIHNIFFDEADGLPWEKKRKQMYHSHRLLLKAMEDNNISRCHGPEDMNVLFYLYSQLSDKTEIKHYFDSYCASIKGKVELEEWIRWRVDFWRYRFMDKFWR